MRTLFCAVSLFAVSLAIVPSYALAAGFSLPEQGGAALGMASAFTAQADDASAAWYNPAAMTQLEGTRLVSGVVLIYPEFTHETTTGTMDTSKRTIHSPISLYATHKLNNDVSFGLSVNNPFGLGTNWRGNSATRNVATITVLKTTEVNPNIAYKLSDNLSVAAGAGYVYLEATLASIHPLSGQEVRITGNGGGWGGNAAIHYRPLDQLHVGLSYRTRVKVEVDGNATHMATSNDASTEITLPDLLQFGISYKPTQRVTLNADLGYTWWTTYDELVIRSATFTGGVLTQQKQWHNVWSLRVGGQYKLTDQWKLRAGYLFDQNPVPNEYFETRTPDSDRHGFAVGVGYSIGNVTIDAGYLYLLFETRNVNGSTADDLTANPNSLNGKYRHEAHLAGMSVGYKF